MADYEVGLKIKADTKEADKNITSFAKKTSKQISDIQEKFGVVIHPEAFNIAKSVQTMKSVDANLSNALDKYLASGNFIPSQAGVTKELESLISAYNSGIGNISQSIANDSGTQSVGRDVDNAKLKSGRSSIKKTREEIERLNKAMNALGLSTKKATGFFDKFSNRIKSIITYRIIRGGLSKLTQYMSEGIQNLVKYEQLLGSISGNKATETMNQLSTSIQTLKNNIGSMAVSILSALMPAIQTLIGWLNTAISYINQFFASLQGKNTYKKATDAVYNYATAVSKARKELQLLSFDELNVLKDNSSTNDGGTSYGDMFKDAEIDSGIANISNKVKPLLEWINTNMDKILKIAVSIGGVLAGWKLSQGIISGMANVVDTLGEIIGFVGLNSILTFTLALAGVALFTEGIVGAIKDGTDAIDVALVTIGLTLAGVALGIMTGVGVLTGGIVGLVVALVTSVGLIIYDSWDDITSGFTTMISKITTKFKEFVNRCIGNINTIIDAINKVITGFNNLFGTSVGLIRKINEIAENALTSKENFKARQADRMASGGIPTTGTLFWAGEAGAEVIGSVGGRTTVYNSDQLGNAMATANADVVNAINTLIGVVRSKSGNVTISASDIRKAVNYSSMRVGV